VNRPNSGNTIVNRPNSGNTVVNRPTNINSNVTNNNITNISTNITNVNRGGSGFGGGRGWGGGYRPNPYSAYHRGWVNGNWNANYNRGWGWNNFGNSALGWGAGIGMAAWGIGSMWNSWGYSSFRNPYYVPTTIVIQQPAVVVQQQPILFDYSRPLDLSSPPPPQSIIEAAGASIDSARSFFNAGDYGQALKLADQALLKTPNDPILHEFRAMCLFALGRYDEAAVPMYTVLSNGPGWDWTTLVGLYPSVDVYTQQLRALENYCNANPGAAAARFVLASLYMTQGSPNHAVEILKQVVALQPQDRLSAQLIEILTPKPEPSEAIQPTNPAQGTAARSTPAPPAVAGTNLDPAQTPGAGPPPEPLIPTDPVPAKLVGSWIANAAKDLTITLTIDGNNGFSWKVTDRGQAREFRGSAAFDDDTLALTPPDQPPMAGKVTWKDDKHFQFRAIGAPPDDAGLGFSRSG
jgi:hypothetical protein